jgi:hypothetical protein
MKRTPWKDQIAEGRVFELKSKSNSKRYQAPCALVIRTNPQWREKMVTQVDRYGVVGNGLYRRWGTNPQIYVDGYCGEEFVKRIARRRPDLERFDCFDLDLIRYGYSLDFDGRIDGYSMPSIPLTRTALWTVFWTPPFDEDYFWGPENIKSLLRGAWYFEHHGGRRQFGYKYGHVWATRHTGYRLRRIRECLRDAQRGVIEQGVRVVRWSDAKGVYISTVQRYCPPLGGGMTTLVSPGSIQGWMSGASSTVICVGARV